MFAVSGLLGRRCGGLARLAVQSRELRCGHVEALLEQAGDEARRVHGLLEEQRKKELEQREEERKQPEKEAEPEEEDDEEDDEDPPETPPDPYQPTRFGPPCKDGGAKLELSRAQVQAGLTWTIRRGTPGTPFTCTLDGWRAVAATTSVWADVVGSIGWAVIGATALALSGISSLSG